MQQQQQQHYAAASAGMPQAHMPLLLPAAAAPALAAPVPLLPPLAPLITAGAGGGDSVGSPLPPHVRQASGLPGLPLAPPDCFEGAVS
jgi:hypothetical protein